MAGFNAPQEFISKVKASLEAAREGQASPEQQAALAEYATMAMATLAATQPVLSAAYQFVNAPQQRRLVASLALQGAVKTFERLRTGG